MSMIHVHVYTSQGKHSLFIPMLPLIVATLYPADAQRGSGKKTFYVQRVKGTIHALHFIRNWFVWLCTNDNAEEINNPNTSKSWKAALELSSHIPIFYTETWVWIVPSIPSVQSYAPPLLPLFPLLSPPLAFRLLCHLPHCLPCLASTLRDFPSHGFCPSHHWHSGNLTFYEPSSSFFSSRQIHNAAISAMSTPGATVTAYVCWPKKMSLPLSSLRSMRATTASEWRQSFCRTQGRGDLLP